MPSSTPANGPVLGVLLAAALVHAPAAASGPRSAHAPAPRIMAPVDDDGVYEVWVSYVEAYPEASRLQALKSKKTATDFFKVLKDDNGWNGGGSKIVANAAAVGTHWKKAPAGAPNGGADYEDKNIDEADIALFLGHGALEIQNFNGRKFYTSVWIPHDGASDKDKRIRYEDARSENRVGVWGDKDLEWVISFSCHGLRDELWPSAFGGLHLLLGYEKELIDFVSALPQGEETGKTLATDMTCAKPLSVCQAWSKLNQVVAARDATYSPVGIAKDKKNFKDYLWGKGDGPEPDPPKYKAGGNAAETSSERWKVKKDGAVPQPNRAGQTGVAMRAANGRIYFLAPGVLGGCDLPTTLPRLWVVPRQVDEAYVRGLAQNLCQSLGVLCSLDTLFADQANRFWATEGKRTLVVNRASGGFSYMDANVWMMPPEARPQDIPSTTSAVALAESFLGATGWRPADASPAPEAAGWARSPSVTSRTPS